MNVNTKYIDILHKGNHNKIHRYPTNVNKTKYIDILHERKQKTSMSCIKENKTKYIDIMHKHKQNKTHRYPT